MDGYFWKSTEKLCIRKYFPRHGWYNGTVTKVMKNEHSGEMLYHVNYEEDGDEDELDESEFIKVKAYGAMNPQPQCPPEVLEALETQAVENLAAPEAAKMNHPPGRMWSMRSRSNQRLSRIRRRLVR